MMQNNLIFKEIEDLVSQKGPGPVLINALELPWVDQSEFDTAVQELIDCGKLALRDKIGDWVIGNLFHYEVEEQTPTLH